MSQQELTQISNFIKNIQEDRKEHIEVALSEKNLEKLKQYHDKYGIKDIFWDKVNLKNLNFENYGFAKYVLSCHLNTKKEDLVDIKNDLLISSLSNFKFYKTVEKDFNLSVDKKVSCIYKTSLIDKEILKELHQKNVISFHPNNFKTALEYQGFSYLEYGLTNRLIKIENTDLNDIYKKIIKNTPVYLIEKFQDNFEQVTYLDLKELFLKREVLKPNKYQWSDFFDEYSLKDYLNSYSDDHMSWKKCSDNRTTVSYEDFFSLDMEKINLLSKTHVLGASFITNSLKYMSEHWDKKILNDKFLEFIEICVEKELPNIQIFKKELQHYHKNKFYPEIEKFLFSLELKGNLNEKKSLTKIKI